MKISFIHMNQNTWNNSCTLLPKAVCVKVQLLKGSSTQTSTVSRPPYLHNKSLKSVPTTAGLTNINKYCIKDTLSHKSVPTTAGLTNMNKYCIKDTLSHKSVPTTAGLTNMNKYYIKDTLSHKSVQLLQGSQT